MVIARESKIGRYALPAAASCIFTVMSSRLYVSGALDILTAGRTRKFRRYYEAIPGGASADLPTDKTALVDVGVNTSLFHFFLSAFERAVERVLACLRCSCPIIPLAHEAPSVVRPRLDPG